MHHIQTPTQSFTVTSASYGQLQLTANTGSDVTNLYRGLVGWINSSTGTPGPVSILLKEVYAAGLVGAVLADHTNNYNTAGTVADLSAYAGGTVYFEKQIAEIQLSKSIVTGIPV